jgi:hypothetical protein
MSIAAMKCLVSVRMVKRSIVIGLLVLSAACAMQAQEKKEPDQRDVKVPPAAPEEPKAPLPKIENPEFVITGQEAVELPAAAKNDASDASAFVPPLPAAGAKQSDVERTASKLTLQQREQGGLNGKVYGTFGNFTTPALGAWFGKSFSEGSMAVNARYASSDGYAQYTQWQSAGFGLAGSYRLPASGDFLSESRWKSEFSMGGDQYRAFGSSAPWVRRTRADLDFAIGFDSRYVWKHPSFSPIDYSTGISWTRTGLTDSASAVENEYAFTTTASGLYETLPVRASFEYRISDEQMPHFDAHMMQWLAMTGDAKVMAAKNLQVSFGASLFAYRGDDTPMSLRLYPRVSAGYFAASWLTIRAGFDPTVTRTSLRSVVKENKYLLNDVLLRPADSPLAVYGGVDCRPLDNAAISVRFEYRRVDDYQSFLETPQTHVWSAVYFSDIRVKKTDVRASYAMSQAGTFTGFVVFTSTTHKDSSAMLPYVPRVNAGIVYRHTFPSNLSVEVTGEYVGKRLTGASGSAANAGYGVLGAKGEYGIAGNFRLSAEIQNLLNQNYYIWDGYRERELFASVGISYLW